MPPHSACKLVPCRNFSGAGTCSRDTKCEGEEEHQRLPRNDNLAWRMQHHTLISPGVCLSVLVEWMKRVRETGASSKTDVSNDKFGDTL